jgi:hypothetical protein
MQRPCDPFSLLSTRRGPRMQRLQPRGCKERSCRLQALAHRILRCCGRHSAQWAGSTQWAQWASSTQSAQRAGSTQRAQLASSTQSAQWASSIYCTQCPTAGLVVDKVLPQLECQVWVHYRLVVAGSGAGPSARQVPPWRTCGRPCSRPSSCRCLRLFCGGGLPMFQPTL